MKKRMYFCAATHSQMFFKHQAVSIVNPPLFLEVSIVSVLQTINLRQKELELPLRLIFGWGKIRRETQASHKVTFNDVYIPFGVALLTQIFGTSRFFYLDLQIEYAIDFWRDPGHK